MDKEIKKKELAEIHYRRIKNGMIEIVALENFMTMEEIAEKHGLMVVAAYGAWAKRMYRGPFDGMVTFGNQKIPPLVVGAHYEKELFSKVVDEAKGCGRDFSAIVKIMKRRKKEDYSSNPTKIIEI